MGDGNPAERESGKPFNRPTDITINKKNGDLFISDGYGNSRINHYDKEGNYIKNTKTGDKFVLRPNGKGSYLMDVEFPGGFKTQITVDSGAEESVCPVNWGEEFGLGKPDKRLNLINASGAKIPHVGQRLVKVDAPF